MEIEVKGHSGCQIDVAKEDDGLFVYKSTVDPKYLERLTLQAEKQRRAAQHEYQHIRIPRVFDICRTDTQTTVKMEYVYSLNFIEFFEHAGFEQVNYLIKALEKFIDYEVGECTLQRVSADIFRSKFVEVRSKVTNSSQQTEVILNKAQSIFDNLEDMMLPVGLCHGDLTFSNILFNGNNYYLIDFLDSFIETPLQDIAKIRQDTCFRWSPLMYTKPYDRVRFRIACDCVDKELDHYFSSKYDWYKRYYRTMQLMNILRILPYAKEQRVVEYLENILGGLINE